MTKTTPRMTVLQSRRSIRKSAGGKKSSLFKKHRRKRIPPKKHKKTAPLQRLDNKDRSTNDPPTQDDVLDVLEGINGNDQVEHLFVDAFNACGPVLMMAINTLLHNPPEFPNQTLRCTATEEFKANPSDDNMMKYLLDSILMRRRSVQRTQSLWDRSRY